MSYNQSNRSEKIETTQYRKTDRRSSSSNQQRSSSGAYGKGGGGPAPSPSYNSSNSRGYKKNSNNAQGGQSRAHVPTVSVNSSANSSTTLDSSATTNAAAASTPRTTTAVVQNGSHVHPQLHADAPVTSAAAKPAEPPAPAAAAAVQRSTRPVPKAPTSQSSAMSSDPAAAPKTPVKAPGDASKPYPFQFGSISPGFMNGMQVPARTSSAPPNLDEQKRDQLRHDSYRPPPPLPIPTAPKQQFPRKDAVAAEQSNTGEAHSGPKVKKDVQILPAPPASQPQKPPVLPPMGGMSMPMQYHQPQVSVQFAGPNQQLQSQGMTAAPLQMQLPMGLSMANAPQVQPPVFLQPHPMQQGIIHQSQYTAQMGPQLPPQLGNMGMGMTPPYPQQQGGKFGGPRKTTVKITHPDTHEELRLDKRADSYSDGGSSAPRSLPNMPPQSQPIPSFASSHPLNFYNPNSFNPSSMFYPPQSSVPLTSSQLAPNSQAPRFNYPVGQNPQNMAYMNPSALNSLPVNKTGTPMHVTADLPNLEHSRDVHNIISSAPPTVIPITVKPTPGSIGEKVADSLLPKSSHGVEKSEPTRHVRPSGEVSSSHPQREVTESLASKSLPVATKQSVVVSAAVSSEGLVSNSSSSASVSPSEESVPVVPTNEGRRRETLSRSNSIKDYPKKISKKGFIQSQHQVGSQSASISSMPSRALEQGISSSSGVFGTVEAKTTVATPTPVTSEGVSSTQQSLSNVSGGTPDASELKSDTVVEASYSVSSEISGARIIDDTLETVHQAKLDKSSSQDEELVNETVGKDEQGENSLPAGSTQVINSSEISSEPISLKSLEFNKEVKESGHDSGLKVVSDEVLTIETAQKRLDEPMSHHAEIDGTTDNLEILNSTDLGSSDVGSSHGEKSSTVDASSSRTDSIGSNEIGTMSGTSDQQSAPIPAPDLKEPTSKPILDQNKAKVTSKATKKKRKEILLKADAAGTTSDLYNAYKAHHDSFRPPHPLPIPTAPKQQFLRKDAVDAEQTNTGEAHSVPKVKKDVQVSPAPPASQPQKPPVLPPMGGMWPMQYHQPQVSVQFAGPNQQLQSQGMTAVPLQMQLPMGLSMANAPQVQPPMFLQPHPMQQGIIHQLGNMGMGPQLPPQLGNMGMGMTPPYPQQQGGKFGGPRKTAVKITHPDTHEELRALRLDKSADSYSDGGSSAPRSLPNIPPQSQPIPSFAPSHPLNFYIPNSFNAGSMFYPPQSSVPLKSSQLAPNSQAPRFNYPVGQNPQNMAYMNPSALNSLPVNKTGTPMHVTVDLPKHEGEDAEIIGGGLAPLPASGAKDKPILDQNKAKVTSKATKKKGKELPSKKKKEKEKRKEICLKADAAGTTSDLYNAYKGPEEKKETILSTDYTESISTCVNEKQAPADAVEVEAVSSEKGGLNKAEPDDWEDAADLSTPKLEVSDDGQLIHGGLDHYDHDGDGSMAKKYSRDFLLKFSEQCSDLPEDFEITSDIEALMSANLNLSHLVERDSYPSPGRIVDRPSGGSRLDRRGSSSSMGEEDRWGRLSGHFPIRDLRLDPVPLYGGNTGFRPSPGGNYGVLRNPRGQAPMQYPGGILSGPSMGSQGGMPRNSPDADRWLRNANIQQKGLFPSPHTPLQMMHKAEKKYEVGKVTDEEQAKQRQLKAILNKLTPQNFDKLFEQVKAVNIDNPDTLTGVISQIFDKALMEPTFCEMYANFCSHLSLELPDFSKDNEKITFKRVLLNKCQEEFERGEREQEEANKADEEGEIKQSAEEREEKRIKARRRMLGNIRLIGELYKKKMLTERIMHACIQKLLGQYDNPDEEDIEALCKLMSTIGEMIDHSKAKENMDAYFERMKVFSNNMNLSSRVRFMLKDSIDLRKNKWQQRRKVEGPKKIEEVHRDAAQERQAQTSRLGGRGSINTSTRRTPMDFSSRGSTMLSPSSAQMGGFRGLPSQVRGFGGQDVRFEDRVPYEARTLSVPLPQRPIGDDSITLGPQGGLARGMSIRGPPAMSSAPAAEISPSAADPRRMAVALNGYSMVTERTTYGPREELLPRYIPDRFAAPAAYDQSSPQERNVNFGNRDLKNPDRSFDRSVVTSPTPRMEGAAVPQNVPSEKLPEERLKDMSIAAIKEFYSARDENEVELCIRDMNAPSFHPSMVSLWVTDSFERKDVERDVLTKLLVNLTKSRDGVLNQAQLIKGFESVMTNLEDAVNDAPRAPEFLGRLFAKVITENVVPLSEIGQLIYQGGEEPGCLLEVGLAADVLGSTLEVIKSEKGDSFLNELRKSSDLRIEDFRPPNPNRSRKLDKFI